MAPEIIRNESYTLSVDFWSLGIILYEILSGKTPFEDESTEKIYGKILKGKIKFPKNID